MKLRAQFDALDSRLERFSEKFPLWFAPMFWPIGCLFWIAEFAADQGWHWTSLVPIFIFCIPAAIFLTLPMGVVNLALWCIVIPLALFYGVVRAIFLGLDRVLK